MPSLDIKNCRDKKSMMNDAFKPIRVCFIILNAYPLFNHRVEELFGGAEVDLYFLATELAKDKRFEVSFVVGDYGQKPIEVHEGVTVIKSVDVSKNLFLGSWRIWRALRRANAHIYVGKAFSLGTFLQALFCKIHKQKYIYRTASGRECDGTYTTKFRFRGRAVIWAVRTAQKVLTQNQVDAQNLLKTVNINSIVIRNGHRLKSLPKMSRDTILWVGRSEPMKKPYLFVDLARQMPEQNFTMICQDTGKDNNYSNLVEQAGKLDNLQLLQRVSFNDIDCYFLRAEVFVNTSDSEGFPNTFIQACKCGTPILSLNVNPDRFLTKYHCGICANNNWDVFVNAIKTLTNPRVQTEYGQNAHKYVEENHDIVKIVEQYKKIFIEVKTSIS